MIMVSASVALGSLPRIGAGKAGVRHRSSFPYPIFPFSIISCAGCNSKTCGSSQWIRQSLPRLRRPRSPDCEINTKSYSNTLLPINLPAASSARMSNPQAAASATRKKLLVFGGNGFLGSRICKAAVSRNWEVTSVSRSGEPNWSSATSQSTPPPWSNKVTWRKANILHPETYKSDLEGASAVVHSMGILLEADYKGVLTGRESPISGLQRAFSATKKGSSVNPLERQEGQELDAGEKDGQFTYELMNRDSAIALAREANAAKVGAFVFISAAAGAPVLPGRYINTKREAETSISSNFPDVRSIFIRAPFLYDPSRTFTMGMAAVTYGGFMANSLTGGNLTWLMGAGGVKPLKADVVAEAVVEGLEDEKVKGPVEVKEIEELATKVWRRGML